MFTGLVEEIGAVSMLRPQNEAVELQIQCRETMKGMGRGDSISVDGICLTVTRFDGNWFGALAGAETLRRTNLVYKQVGAPVNLERSLTLDKRIGGHLVQGHVDGMARVASIKQEGDSQIWRFSIGPDLARYLVPKGSVAVNGVSLTVVEAGADYFTVSVIPKTLSATTFQYLKVEAAVNIETDIIGKYVFRYLHPDAGSASAAQSAGGIVTELIEPPERINN